MDYDEMDEEHNYRFENQGYAPDIIDSMKPAYYFNDKNWTDYG